MRRATLVLLLAALLPAGAALAHGRCEHRTRLGHGAIEPPVTWGERHDERQARFSMPTRDGGAVLLLTRGRVAVQLSDRTLRRLDDELERDEAEDEDDGVLGSAIRGAVIGGVRALLRHSLECPLDELRDVRYRDGRLELITVEGDRILEGFEVNDRDLLESFSSGDARAFVQEFHRLRDGGR